MFDFVFHNPTKIVFGRGQEQSIGLELKQAGVKKVLFVHGRNSIKRSGLFDRVAASLKESGVRYVEFGGVDSNPVLSHTRQGVKRAKQEGVDGVLAVGGGSVLDEGKAIAVGAKAADDVWHYFTGRKVTEALPVFTVLTLAATGSEMNGNAVVTNEETKQKYNISSPLVYPRVSILNPELTCSVPPAYSAYGAVDAIAHVIEGYFTRKAGTHLQDRLVESIIKTVMETTEVIMREPGNYEARAEFMWGATLALNGLTTAGLKEYSFPNHMIEHSLSAIYNIAHGAGLAIVMPAWMKWYCRKNPSRFERFAREVFGLEGSMAGIEALEKWFVSIQAPVRLRDGGIPAGDIEMIAENGAALATLWGISDMYRKEEIADILRLAV
ncbi:MAG: iron-containing alcohol dehydrogenase [Deltaproteobacteria bacterium]|nr:iron-containing alcohol dehydrogenase [Deltaproteobacteria bacterium]